MPDPDLIELFVAPMQRAGLDRYMISGSLASIEYGEPRSTLGVDIAVMLSAGDAQKLAEAYQETSYYFPPVDVVVSEIARPSRGHFNVIHIASGLKADFYPSRNHPLFGWAFEHRRNSRISGLDVWLAPPEYIILWKLEFFREGGGTKHRRDIQGMLAVSGQEIDTLFLQEWAGRLGLKSQWDSCSALFLGGS